MGMTIQGLRPLVAAYRSGVCFDRTLTIGRQERAVSPREIERVFRELGCDPRGGREAIHRECRTRFCEPCFRLLGAQEVLSLDASAYEGADLIHDLNLPVERDWHERFDVVFDGGSLEHVFDFPTALRSCMQMVKVGGHFMAQTPTNNWCGHGFYQLSAELFYGALCPANGFRVTRMLALEFFDGGRFYEVSDPAAVQSRVQLVNAHRVVLHVEARREAAVPQVLARAPQQADYASRWRASHAAGRMEPPKPPKRRRRKALRAWLLGAVARGNRRLAARLARSDAARRNRRFAFERRPDLYRRTEP